MSIGLSPRGLRLPGYESAVRITTTQRADSQILWTLRILAMIALASSLYLAWIALTGGTVSGCGTGGTLDCSHVLDSRWSTLLGIPVSVPAVVLHFSVLAMLFVPQRWRIAAWRKPLIMLASFTAALGAVWFLGLQVFWLQHLCMYCVVVHLCGIAMAATATWWGRSSARMTLRLLTIAAFLLAALVAGQLLITPPEKFEVVDHDLVPPSNVGSGFDGQSEAAQDDRTYTPPSKVIFQSPLSDSVSRSPHSVNWMAAWNPVGVLTFQVAAGAPVDQPLSTSGTTGDRKTATVLSGVELDATQWPLLGKPDAEIVIAEMLDYTCVHCQTTHKAIHAAMQQYGDRLAIIVLPVPLDASCNSHIAATSADHAESCRLAKLAISVWHQAPDQFSSFHHWLMETKPRYAQAAAHAETLVGGDKLRATLNSRLPSEFIAKNLELYQRASAGTIPKLLFPTATAVGEIRSPQAIVELIHRHFEAR